MAEVEILQPKQGESEAENIIRNFVANLYAKIKAYRESLKQKGSAERQKQPFAGLAAVPAAYKDPNDKNDLSIGMPLTEAQAVELMDFLHKNGVNINEMIQNGDADRLLLGRVTKGVYVIPALEEENQLVERKGNLFLDENGKLQVALQKENLSLIEGLTEEQNQILQSTGRLLTPTHLYIVNKESNRCQQIPVDEALEKMDKKFLSRELTDEEKKMLLEGKRVRVKYECLKDQGKYVKIQQAFVECKNPLNGYVTVVSKNDLVPIMAQGAKLNGKERHDLLCGKEVKRDDFVDNKGQRYTGTLVLTDKGQLEEISSANGQVPVKNLVWPDKKNELQVKQNNEGTVLKSQAGESFQAVKSGENPMEKVAKKERLEDERKKKNGKKIKQS